MTDRFAAAVAALMGAVADESLTEPLLDALPVSGAAVSTLGELLGSETISASDTQIARVDELQFDLGEGPCWDALASGHPVLEPDVRSDPRGAWAAFSAAIMGEDIGGLFAFPMMIGPLRIGAIDLYTAAPTELSALHVQQASALAALVSRHVLRQALRMAGQDDPESGAGIHSRRTIHQATGMVLAQLDISADDAHLLIQGRAFADGRSMHEVAGDITAGRLSFAVERDGIEER
jgi:GAF domain-containing protein